MSNIDLFDILGVEAQCDESIDKRYTEKVGIPVYSPNCRCPNILELCDMSKYSRLIRKIDSSDVSQEEKTFLKIAASRHIVFNYGLIADYYAHADKAMQEQMEKSALVIIDFNKAIEYGYAKFAKNIERIQKETGRPARPDENSDGGGNL